MNKKITAIITLLIIVCTLFIFVACDGNGDATPDNNPSGNIPSGSISSGESGSGEEVGEAIFTTNGNGVITKLTDYGKTLTQLTIPSQIGQERITAIGDYACSGAYNMTSLTISDGVSVIGAHAFEYCDQLLEVVMPSSATSIGENAFCHCDRLTSIKVPEGVSKIEASAFQYCFELESIELPSTLEIVEGLAFFNCTKLKNIYLTDIASWCNLQINVGLNDDKRLNINEKYIYLNGEDIGDLVIPADVTSIRANAFNNCRNLTSVKISDSVTQIGEKAFYECKAMVRAEIPSSVTTIGQHAFVIVSGVEMTVYCQVDAAPSGWDEEWYTDEHVTVLFSQTL